MGATVLTFAVASLIVVAPSTPAYSQETATAVPAATQQIQTPAVGSDTIQFGGRTIAAACGKGALPIDCLVVVAPDIETLELIGCDYWVHGLSPQLQRNYTRV